ncbi:MAG: tRNA pseudouridine(55) synthase TruB [Burkholderiaceae bacterium]
MTALPARLPRRALNGVLVLDKPVGPSSTQALSAAKRLFGALKAGHGGTLDPMASGILPVLFGEATKFAQQGLDADKTYVATVALGQETDTGDAEGQVVSRQAVCVTRAELEQVLVAQLGSQDQKPPMYSALKHQGRPLYEYARAGQTVDKPARQIHIHQIDLLSFDSPRAVIRVRCSKGTYIRVLAQTIGHQLGCGAHLAALRRTGVGSLQIEQAISLEALDAMALQDREACLLPVDALAGHWPTVVLSPAEAQELSFGRSIDFEAERLSQVLALAGCHSPDKFRLYDTEQHFLGTGQVIDHRLWPARLVAQPLFH